MNTQAICLAAQPRIYSSEIKKATRHILITCQDDTRINLKELAKQLDVKKLSFASPERLMEHLGVEPGSVSLLALINDQAKNVEVLIEKKVYKADLIQCHPLDNTATIIISMKNLKQFMVNTGHSAKAIEL